MSKDEASKVDRRFQHYADVAASVQTALEEAVLALAAKLKRDTGEEDLCLAGGVALNSTMNGRLIRESGYQKIHIPPDPGDGGGALGAALYLNSKVNPSQPACIDDFVPAYGLEFDEKRAVDLIAGLDFHELNEHRSLPSKLGPLRGISTEEYRAENLIPDLQSGKIVGWVHGPFENGARALGHRSILIDPRHAEAAKRLSRDVKLRAAFRPYACSLPAEKRHVLFDGMDELPPGARWMSSTHPVKESGRPLISQALHVDGTTRPQLLLREENPRYYDLLRTWEQASGTPALLNTSFNESGFPIVSTPVDALLMFLRTDMDTLVLNNTVLRKKI